MHGLALNVAPNLDHFRLIVPCGIHGAEATSIAALLGREVPLEEADERARDAFAQVFGARVAPTGVEAVTG